ncbi:MAG: PxxKW family cysteine-rich protein [Thermodesulfobacteriota bacterium]
MKCATVKEGVQCSFMGKKGCEFNGGRCQPIVEKCEGCDRAKPFPDGIYCQNFPSPVVKWRTGICNMATHAKVDTKQVDSKVRIGQQKQKRK